MSGTTSSMMLIHFPSRFVSWSCHNALLGIENRPFRDIWKGRDWMGADLIEGLL